MQKTFHKIGVNVVTYYDSKRNRDEDANLKKTSNVFFAINILYPRFCTTSVNFCCCSYLTLLLHWRVGLVWRTVLRGVGNRVKTPMAFVSRGISPFLNITNIMVKADKHFKSSNVNATEAN